MAKELTDLEVEMEIEQLLSSPHVKLSKKEQAIKNKRRQYLYTLRWHEKHGKELESKGITFETLTEMEKEMD